MNGVRKSFAKYYLHIFLAFLALVGLIDMLTLFFYLYMCVPVLVGVGRPVKVDSSNWMGEPAILDVTAHVDH